MRPVLPSHSVLPSLDAPISGSASRYLPRSRGAPARLFALMGTLALFACGNPETATDETETPKGPAASPVTVECEGVVRGAEPALIPAAFRGRWAPEPAACLEGSGSQQIMTITADQIGFYESVATIGTLRAQGDDRITASVDFSGEGMRWTRDMALSTQDGDDMLIRREMGEGAAPGAQRYVRC